VKYTIQNNGEYYLHTPVLYTKNDFPKISIVREELVSVSKPRDRPIVDEQLNSISHISQFRNDRFWGAEKSL
jgi:hypothetical protein